MYAKEKKIPFTDIVVETYLYNIIILLMFSAIMAFKSVLFLVYREKISDMLQKIKFGKNK
jgi:hypothetical protein